MRSETGMPNSQPPGPQTGPKTSPGRTMALDNIISSAVSMLGENGQFGKTDLQNLLLNAQSHSDPNKTFTNDRGIITIGKPVGKAPVVVKCQISLTTPHTEIGKIKELFDGLQCMFLVKMLSYTYNSFDSTALMIMEADTQNLCNLEQQITKELISDDKKFKLISQLWQAIDFLQNKSMYFTDIKATNMLMTNDGELKIFDYERAHARVEDPEQQQVSESYKNHHFEFTPCHASNEICYNRRFSPNTVFTTEIGTRHNLHQFACVVLGILFPENPAFLKYTKDREDTFYSNYKSQLNSPTTDNTVPVAFSGTMHILTNKLTSSLGATLQTNPSQLDLKCLLLLCAAISALNCQQLYQCADLMNHSVLSTANNPSELNWSIALASPVNVRPNEIDLSQVDFKVKPNLFATNLDWSNATITLEQAIYLKSEHNFLNFVTITGESNTPADLSNAHLTGADLRSANLSGADLTDADLRSANLTRTYLSGADLTDADLTGADLRSANLSGADLSNAHLTGADLRSANLSGADLTNADLRSANLTRTYLSGADLSGADLRGATIDANINITHYITKQQFLTTGNAKSILKSICDSLDLNFNQIDSNSATATDIINALEIMQNQTEKCSIPFFPSAQSKNTRKAAQVLSMLQFQDHMCAHRLTNT